MKHKIGIRYEDKYLMERRVALVPAHVKVLREKGFEIEVVPSDKRVFKDQEYVAAGAVLKEAPLSADIILGVKEMPIDYFEAGKTYIFFSHTIKGQEYNMPLLQNMIDRKASLIDYERIVDEQGRRLIFFGRFAGLAGTINSLWSLGQRMKVKGVSSPFERLQQTHHYDSLEEAKAVISGIGKEIAANGLPEELTPLVIGVTGNGNVSKGAQEILQLLPVKEIEPGDLASLRAEGNYDAHTVYKVIFEEPDLVECMDSSQPFNLQEYYDEPEKYRSVFDQYIPQLTVLMNCMYWDDRYPRIVTREYLKNNWNESFNLKVIGDVTCDPEGSVEITFEGTKIVDPVFTYDPDNDTHQMGFEGKGILVMAVEILPSELPRESSLAFSEALIPFLPDLAEADLNVPFEQLDIPAPLKRAMILHHGQLTPDYEYLQQYLDA
ncbi:MAG: hypothetical protein JXR71_11590 [Bacteroidales bacterium]|nr:hypothetical protein [Bacteroidales bacterium]